MGSILQPARPEPGEGYGDPWFCMDRTVSALPPQKMWNSLQCFLNSFSRLDHVWMSATVQPVEVRGQPQYRLVFALYFT